MEKQTMDNPPPYSEAIKQQQHGTNMPPPQPQPSAPVLVVPTYGPDPQITICPSCHASIQTRVEHKPNTNTHVIALLLLLLFWPCALYPYCTDTCQDALHYCPNCGTFLGVYHQS